MPRAKGKKLVIALTTMSPTVTLAGQSIEEYEAAKAETYGDLLKTREAAHARLRTVDERWAHLERLIDRYCQPKDDKPPSTGGLFVLSQCRRFPHDRLAVEPEKLNVPSG